MEEANRRLRIGWGVTTPRFFMTVKQDVFNEVLKILCLDYDLRNPEPKSKVSRFRRSKGTQWPLTASDLNHVLYFNSPVNRLLEIHQRMGSYRFPPHIEPESVLSTMFELLYEASGTNPNLNLIAELVD